MSSVREHLGKEVHEADAAQWDVMHKGLAKLAGISRQAHKASGMGDNQDGPHKQAADELDKLAGTCAAHAEHHRDAAAKCNKAAVDELNKLVPTDISAVAPDRPGIRSVPRPGQPELPAKPNVDEQFRKLVSVEDGSEIELNGRPALR